MPSVASVFGGPFKLEWRIRDFSLCSLAHGQNLVSPKYKLNIFKKATCWRLIMYPRGKHEEDMISIYLTRESDSNRESIKIDCVISIASVTNETYFLTEGKNIDFVRDTVWGTDNLIRRDSILSGQLPHDVLIIVCEISASSQMILTENPFERRMLSTLSEDLRLLYSSGKYTDITLYAGRKPFHVHKAILMTRWPHILTQIEQEPFVRIQNVSISLLHSIIEYLYTGKLCTAYPFPEMLKFVEQYQISNLENLLKLNPTKYTAHTQLSIGHATLKWNIGYQDFWNQVTFPFTRLLPISEVYVEDVLAHFEILTRDSGEEILKISFNFDQFKSDKPVFMRCKIFISQDNGEVSESCSHDHFFENNQLWTLPTSFEKNRISQLKNPVMRCELTLCDGAKNSFVHITWMEINSEFEYEDLKQLSSDIFHIYEAKWFSDFVLKAGLEANLANNSYICHRAIVTARSRYFNQTIQSSSSSETLELRADVLNFLLEYMYSGNVNRAFFSQNLQLIRDAAIRYGFPELLEINFT